MGRHVRVLVQRQRGRALLLVVGRVHQRAGTRRGYEMGGRGHGHDVLGMVLLMVRMVDGTLLAVHKLPYFGIVFVADVVRQVGLLEPGGGHALVAGVGARRGRARIRRVEARLYECFARLGRDHRLQLARGERVHVTRFGRHQQHDLRAGQRGQLVRLKRCDTTNAV